ncbi:hypothetical protein PHMEG_00032814 [Phytophthora megakarya]|uniref:CCHC-type domain-containing protein n=1 Tax=Phytophthora megakarya TaxID=4795 RepID=A0A225UUL0_9STRA|nr:hypothetical protein PHMEG_00032814 [Phytophthora megakarya]
MVMAADDDNNTYNVGNEKDREDGEPRAPPPTKKRRVAARRTRAATRQVKGLEAPKSEPGAKTTARNYDQTKCYACNEQGHIAAYCPDAEARTRNNAYPAQWNQELQQENEKRAL